MTRSRPAYLRLLPPPPAGRWLWTVGQDADGQSWCGWQFWPEAPPDDRHTNALAADAAEEAA